MGLSYLKYMYLRSGDNHTDKGIVISSSSLHTPVQPLGKVRRTAPHTLDCV